MENCISLCLGVIRATALIMGVIAVSFVEAFSLYYLLPPEISRLLTPVWLFLAGLACFASFHDFASLGFLTFLESSFSFFAWSRLKSAFAETAEISVSSGSTLDTWIISGILPELFKWIPMMREILYRENHEPARLWIIGLFSSLGFAVGVSCRSRTETDVSVAAEIVFAAAGILIYCARAQKIASLMLTVFVTCGLRICSNSLTGAWSRVSFVSSAAFAVSGGLAIFYVNRGDLPKRGISL